MGVADLDPGAFSARLVLQARQEQADGQGGVTVQWATVSQVWAHIKPVSMAFGEEANGERFGTTHEIWLRAGLALESGMRFSRGHRVFKINGWHDPDETGRYTLCRCEEIDG